MAAAADGVTGSIELREQALTLGARAARVVVAIAERAAPSLDERHRRRAADQADLVVDREAVAASNRVVDKARAVLPRGRQIVDGR